MELVLLTGASGFIAKHVALKLLNAGYPVRGTLRRLDRADEVRAALAPHLTEGGRCRGVWGLARTASPFPIAQPKDPATVVRPAVGGTERVLKAAAAAGVERVILTSSCVAVTNDSKLDTLQDEADWCDIHLPATTAYARSKTLAERTAWELARSRHLKLTTINPCFVLGPPLDGHYGASLGLVERVLKGRDPMTPPFGMPLVDVRDVAEMHLRALKRPETAGKRYIAAAGSMAFVDIGRTLKAAYPVRRIATREAPQVLIRLMALFDGELRSILPKLGHLERVSNARAVREMGMEFIAPKSALLAAADWLVKHGKVWA